MYRSRFSCAFAALALIAAPSGAAVLEWPGAAPCNGTLQACVDSAASGDTIVVVSEATISGGVEIDSKNLTLRAAPGLRPVLATGTGISASSTDVENLVAVEGFALRDGRINLNYSGVGNAHFTVRNNTFDSSSHETSTGISIQNAGTGTTITEVENNRITTGTPVLNSAALRLRANGGTLAGQVVHNRLEGLPADTSGWGIMLDGVGGSVMDVALGFNEVRGKFSRSAIGVSEGLFSSTPSQLKAHVYSNVMVCGGEFARGIGSTINSGNINIDVINNTIVSCSTALGYARWSGSPGSGGIEGLIRSNVVAFNQRGMFLNPEFIATIEESENLFWANPFNQPGPDASSITADPLFLSPQHPFLRAGSPAINSGYPFSPLMQDNAGLPQLDAAGLRRVRGSQVDMGAYEYGDTSLLHTADTTNTLGHITHILGAPFGGGTGVRLQVTPSYDGGFGPEGPLYSHPFGVYLAGEVWRIFSQDFAHIPVGAHFNIFAPEPGNGVFSHVSNTGNVSGWNTRIDHPMLDNQPDKFVLVTQNWTVGGANVYNAHPVGVFYDGIEGAGHWLVANIDQPIGESMQMDVGFNIYTQPRSPNAFLAEASPATVTGQVLTLTHPLLDGTPCAQLQVTRNATGTRISEHFDVRYDDTRQRWTILHHDAPMPVDARFFVLVDPHQIAFCRGDLFRDGFE